jgi:hypothetical protein
MSEYYTQSPAYQDQMERLAQQALFSKDEPAAENTEEAAPDREQGKESSQQKVSEE